MKIRVSGVSPLKLSAYAPALRLMARVADRGSFLSYKETVGASDSLLVISSFLRNLADQIAVSEMGLPKFSIAKALVESLDTFDGAVSLNPRKAFTDLSTALDSFALQAGKGLAESVTTTELKSFASSKGLADAGTVADLPCLKWISSFADLAQAVDTFSAVWAYAKTVTETSNTSDVSFRKASKPQFDNVTFADAFTRAIAKAANETASISPEFFGKSISKPFTDSTTQSDSLTRSSIINRTLIESGPYVADGYWVDGYFAPTPVAGDTLRLTPEKAVTDSAFTTELVKLLFAFARNFAEAAQVSERINFASTKNFTDTKTATDSVAKNYSMLVVEGGFYVDPAYFAVSDYVSGGLAVGESFRHTP